MKVKAPCRMGEMFSYDGIVQASRGKFVLTGLTFFAWSTPGMEGVTLCAKRDPDSKQECTRFYEPKQAAEGVRIAFDIPDEIISPGYPLRELGLNTDAVGYLQGLSLTDNGWEYHIYYGRSYGGPREAVRTEKLDRIFKPVLPLHAVQVDLKNYLL